MKNWHFSGFNGFGQFRTTNDNSRFSKLKSFEVESIDENFLINPGWSCNIIAIKNELLFCGYGQRTFNISKRIKLPDKIVGLCSTDIYCLILLSIGKLFKLCRKDFSLQEIKFFQEEIVKSKKRTASNEIKEPCQRNLFVEHIACGTNLAVAITSDNSVFNIPSKVFEFPPSEKIISLQCGFEHALALTAGGSVYAWGNGLRGQLGIDSLELEEAPVLIEALDGIKIIDIAAGGWHSAAVSSFGDIYVWGYNCSGQLGVSLFSIDGVKNPTVYPLPQLVDFQECCEYEITGNSCNIISVDCGARHTIAKTSCGTIYACGWNSYGQLALDKDESVIDGFQKINEIPKCEVSVICGPWCTLFKINQKS